MNALRTPKLSQREYDALFKRICAQVIPEVVAVCCLRNHYKKWGKKRVQKYFDDICALYQQTYLYGKKVTGEQVKEFMEKEYDLDFSKLPINTRVE